MGGDGAVTTGAWATAVALVLLLALVGVAWAASRARRARREAEERRDEADRRTAVVLGAGRDGLLLHTPAGVVLAVNDAFARLVDAAPDELVGRALAELPVAWVSEHGQAVQPATVVARRTHVGPGEPVPYVVGAVPSSGGAIRWVQVSTVVVPTPDGGHELVTTFLDQTGPREIRAALARSENQFRAAMENAPIGMALLDPKWRLEQVNDALGALLAADARALRGRDLSALSHPDDRAAERAQVQRLLAGDAQRFSLEKRYLRSDGQTVWAVLDVVLVRTPEGAPETFVAQVRDVTEARMQAEMLSHRAHHDPLTGVANRTRFQEVLEGALAQPDAEGRVAVILVDLDEFKMVNDRYGHSAGDEVLVHVAGVLRAATAGRGTVARMGGDEFVVVVQDGDAARVVFDIASGIHTALRQPVRTQRRRLPVHASLGVAVADTTLAAAGAAAMLAAADAALYRAKAAGRGRTEVYDPSMGTTAATRLGAAAELAAAIEAGQLLLHYQPTVDLTTGHVVGHEALVRWQHPEHGLLLPGAFLPMVTESGLGAALGATVIRQAVQYLARTAEIGRWVSVNVSADHLGDGQFVAQLLQDVRSHDIAPGRLVVELTEAVLGDPGSRVRQEIAELRAAGVPVLLDDFGTGAAPLAYLRDMPVDGVKLDMSFTAGIPEDPAAARVSRALGALAREMEMVTIAEGIENAHQATFLHSCGWLYGQGWFFGAGVSEPVQQLAYDPRDHDVADGPGDQDRPVDPGAITVRSPGAVVDGPGPAAAGVYPIAASVQGPTGITPMRPLRR